MIGQTISHYRILEKLGGGGMGVVYKAEDTKLHRIVALKFLPPAFSFDEEAKQRFVHEAQAASSLQHNNICNIHDIDETQDGQIFICMDCYEGETLKKKIELGQIKTDEAIDIIVQVATGLQKAHEKGIIHRDIKPANIFITNDGVVKILDFGLAKLSGQTMITKMGSTLGTVAYMSPEQARGEQVDNRTDIWALGVVLYQMLSGKLPFNGEYEQAVIYSILNVDPTSISSLSKKVRPEIERIILKTLEKNRDHRYQSVYEILAELGIQKEKQKASHRLVDSIRKPFRRQMFYILAALIILSFLYLVYDHFTKITPSANKPIPLVIVTFENLTGNFEFDYLKKVIPTLIITSLEQSGYFQVLTWERMRDILAQLGKKNIEVIDNELGFQICQMEGIDIIALGSFTKVGNIFATDIKLLDVKSKKIIKTAQSKGKGENSILESQIDELSQEISYGMGIAAEKMIEAPLKISQVTTSSLEAYNYYLRGKEEYEKFYYDNARKFLEKAVELDSTFAAAYLELAQAYTYLRMSEARHIAYQKAKKYAVRSGVKERLYIEASYASAIERDRERMIDIYKTLIQKYPQEKLAHYRVGLYHWDNRRYDQAVREFDAALQLDPNYTSALNMIAYTYAAQKEFPTAIRYLERYATVSPGDANPFDSMAEIYFKMGRFSEAIQKYKEALDVKSDFGSEWRIAYLFALQDNYSESLNWIDQFIERSNTPGLIAEGYLWQGFYHYWQYHLTETPKDIDKIKYHASKVENVLWIAYAHLLSGWLFLELQQTDRSRVEFGKYYKLIKNFNSPYTRSYTEEFPKAEHQFNLGIVDLKSGNLDSAQKRIKIMDETIASLEPANQKWVKFHRDLLQAEIYLSLNKIDLALSVIQSAPEMDFPDMHTEYVLRFLLFSPNDIEARIYQKKGLIDSAIKVYERLLGIDTTFINRQLVHPILFYRLALLYEDKGKHWDASAMYKKFLQLMENANPMMMEIENAKKRLNKLFGMNKQ